MGSGKEYGVSHLISYVNNKRKEKVKFSTHLMVDTNLGHRMLHSDTYEPNHFVEVMQLCKLMTIWTFMFGGNLSSPYSKLLTVIGHGKFLKFLCTM